MLSIDANRGRELAPLLYNTFKTCGIFGHKEMPEYSIPSGMERSSLDHLLFITLTVSIDFMRDANALWKSARETYEDPETKWLFHPPIIVDKDLSEIEKGMQKHSLAKKPNKDAEIWKRIASTFQKKWQGDPRNFLKNCNYDAICILKRLKEDNDCVDGVNIDDFPYLRGDKIGPLWLRMLRDCTNINELQNLDQVPIPVDRHIARVNLVLGIVRGQYKGKLEPIKIIIQQAWFESVKGLEIDGRPMIALDLDEPLWHLSKYGCVKRSKTNRDCPLSNRCCFRKYCVEGKIYIHDDDVEIDT